MKEENKKMLSIFVVVILAASTIATAVTFGMKYLEEEEEKEEGKPLSATILAEPSSGTAPHTVNFKPLILNYQGSVKYTWEFGDGETSNEKNPMHVYKKEGSYSCKLTVEDENRKKTDYGNITVFPNNPPKVKIKCDTTAFRPKKIYFDAEVFDPEGEELQYSWILKHPPRLLGTEKIETFSTKSFSKTFFRPGRYVAELTVTDESANQVTDYEIVQVQKSQIELLVQSGMWLLTLTLPSSLSFFWGLIGGPPEKLISFLDNNWLDWGPGIQGVVSFILRTVLAINYEPPVPKAELTFSEIDDIDLSAYVNDTTGEVEEETSVSSSFTITNNDSSNIAKNVYIALDHPLSEEEGLVDEIEVEELVVSIDVDGTTSHKLFYSGKYTSWENCYHIEKLAPGDNRTMDITVTLNEGGTFKEGRYKCTRYIYQEKALDKAEYVDTVDFEIIL